MDFMKNIFSKIHKPGEDTSKAGSFDWTDALKVLRTGIATGVACTIAYYAANLENMHLPAAVVVAIPLIKMGLEAANKWLTDHTA